MPPINRHTAISRGKFQMPYFDFFNKVSDDSALCKQEYCFQLKNNIAQFKRTMEGKKRRKTSSVREITCSRVAP